MRTRLLWIWPLGCAWASATMKSASAQIRNRCIKKSGKIKQKRASVKREFENVRWPAAKNIHWRPPHRRWPGGKRKDVARVVVVGKLCRLAGAFWLDASGLT